MANEVPWILEIQELAVCPICCKDNALRELSCGHIRCTECVKKATQIATLYGKAGDNLNGDQKQGYVVKQHGLSVQQELKQDSKEEQHSTQEFIMKPDPQRDSVVGQKSAQTSLVNQDSKHLSAVKQHIQMKQDFEDSSTKQIPYQGSSYRAPLDNGSFQDSPLKQKPTQGISIKDRSPIKHKYIWSNHQESSANTSQDKYQTSLNNTGDLDQDTRSQKAATNGKTDSQWSIKHAFLNTNQQSKVCQNRLEKNQLIQGIDEEYQETLEVNSLEIEESMENATYESTDIPKEHLKGDACENHIQNSNDDQSLDVKTKENPEVVRNRKDSLEDLPETSTQYCIDESNQDSRESSQHGPQESPKHNCKENQKAKAVMPCPVFKVHNDVTKLDVLPVHPLLMKHIQRIAKTKHKDHFTCSMCHHWQGRVCCAECKNPLCDACAIKHKQTTTYGEHHIVHSALLFCLKHEHQVSHMCTDCQKFICTSCITDRRCRNHHADDRLLEILSGWYRT